MPLPSREDKALARQNALKAQQQRNAAAFKANAYGEHDAEAAKAAKAKRAKTATSAPARRPGSSRTASFPHKKADK